MEMDPHTGPAVSENSSSPSNGVIRTLLYTLPLWGGVEVEILCTVFWEKRVEPWVGKAGGWAQEGNSETRKGFTGLESGEQTPLWAGGDCIASEYQVQGQKHCHCQMSPSRREDLS